MADFLLAHEFTAKWEGGLSDVPQDRGGITKYGVSLNFLRNFATSQPGRDVLDRMGIILPATSRTIRDLTLDQARSIFRAEFWNPLRLDTLPQRPATFLYDCAVNHGSKRSVVLAQRGYNSCVGPYGVKLAEDGILGPATRAGLAHDTDPIISGCIAARRRFFEAIVRNDQSQDVFLRGWLNRCDDLARVLGVH